jgi:hypothetical protein
MRQREALKAMAEKGRFKSNATTDACLRQPHLPGSTWSNRITTIQRHHVSDLRVSCLFPCTASMSTLLIRVTQPQIVRLSLFDISSLLDLVRNDYVNRLFLVTSYRSWRKILYPFKSISSHAATSLGIRHGTGLQVCCMAAHRAVNGQQRTSA